MMSKYGVCLLAAVGLLQNAAIADDETTLRQNIVNSLTGGSVNVGDINALAAGVRADGTFNNINYASNEASNWGPINHVYQLRTLAVAYATPGAAFTATQKTALRDATVRAYNNWVNTNYTTKVNWWFGDIGVPLALSDSMLLLQHANVLPANNFAAAANIVKKAKDAEAAKTFTAANLMWLSYASRNEAVLRYLQPGADANTKNAAKAQINYAYGDISSTFALTNGDGVQRDASYHAHGPIIYDGGYGLAWISDAGRVAAQGAGTNYGVSSAAAKTMIDYLLDGAQWMDRGDSIDPLVTGREISRSGTNRKALSHRNAAVQALAIGEGYRAAELTKMRDRLNYASSNSTADPSNMLSGNKQFRRSDYMVHQRPGGMFSVKTVSTRTNHNESINSENFKATHMFSGVNLIHRSGNEYDNLAPVWDWYRLPGTTTERGTYSLLPRTNQKGSTAFVGGASDGTNGMTVYKQNHLNVTGNKAWMMSGNAQFALGNSIAAPAAGASNRIGTNLNQTKLNGTVTYSTAAGSSSTLAAGQTQSPSGLRWVNHDGVGYFFLTPADNATISTLTQSGSWNAINNSQSSATINTPVFAIDLDHGTRPTAASYAYLVVAGINANQMDAYLAGNPFSVMKNDATAMAVKDHVNNLIEATFLQPTSITTGSFTLQQTTEGRGSSVLLKTAGNTITLSAASPDQWSGTMTYLVNRHLVGPGAVWDAATGLTTLTYALPGGTSAGATVTQSYTVAVPEPAALSLVMGAGLTLRRRRTVH